MVESVEHRRKRVVFRCRNRGMLETSVVLRHLAESIDSFGDGELDRLEILLDAPDDVLWSWIAGRSPAPPDIEPRLLEKLRTLGKNGQNGW